MAFITEKEELKPGLILFRRGDVDHRMWYCRMKMPKADRYKTVSLTITDISAARERAFDQDADVRFRIKHDVPVFNRPFRYVAREYLLTQEARAKRGEISAAGQGQVAQAGCAQKRRRLFRTHPRNLQSHGTGR